MNRKSYIVLRLNTQATIKEKSKLGKSGADRAAKYLSKFDPTVIGARATATKDAACAAQAVHQPFLADKAAAVRAILSAKGTAAILTVQYMAFAMSLYRICNKFCNIIGTHNTSLTATAEAKNKLAVAHADGADHEILYAIWNTLYADMLGACPTPVPTVV
jgi:hypothetical protein